MLYWHAFQHILLRNQFTFYWLSLYTIYAADLIIMAALWNRAGHYIFILSFVLSFFLFSSPNLGRRRLDVCHTSTHGVALVRI